MPKPARVWIGFDAAKVEIPREHHVRNLLAERELIRPQVVFKGGRAHRHIGFKLPRSRAVSGSFRD